LDPPKERRKKKKRPSICGLWIFPNAEKKRRAPGKERVFEYGLWFMPKKEEKESDMLVFPSGRNPREPVHENTLSIPHPAIEGKGEKKEKRDPPQRARKA